MGSLCFTGYKSLLQLRRACLPAIQRASQPAASFFRIITFRTRTGTSFNSPWAATSLNSRISSQRQAIYPQPTTRPFTRRSHIPANQSIKWIKDCMDQWDCRDLEWRGRHFLCFLWATVTNLACVILLPSPAWNNVVPEKDLKHSVAILANQAVNPHYSISMPIFRDSRTMTIY